MGQSPSAVCSVSDRAAILSNPSLCVSLARFIRGRVPADEVDDIVQSTLADALASKHAPADRADVQPWVYGIARNKIADFYRRSRRELPHDPALADAVPAADAAPSTARDLLRWATKELPAVEGAESTLEWMLREGSGERLETIAAEAKVPAPRVRQRVARMRRHFRARWAAQLAAVACLVTLTILVILALVRSRGDDIAVPAPSFSQAPVPPPLAPPPREEDSREARDLNDAKELRRAALVECEAKDWRRCLDGLDAAKRLDPAGDAAEPVQRARRAANDALEKRKAPPPVAPSSSGAPRELSPRDAGAPPLPLPSGFGSSKDDSKVTKP